MKNKGKLSGLIAVIAAIVFCFAALSLTGCGGGGSTPQSGPPDSSSGPTVIPPEDRSVAERWWKWVHDTSTATLEYSVADDGVCTITVGGTADSTGWKALAGYSYTAKAGASYEYIFEAWTESGDRDLHIDYYEDPDDYDAFALDDSFLITNTRRIYTITGESLPKGGENAMRFHCANKTGTLYVKILGIQEVASYNAIYLSANRWDNADGGSGEQWTSGDQIKLSDFTNIKPKQGNVLKFKISGKSNMELEYIQIQLFNHTSNWSESTFIGASDLVNLSRTFNDYIITINISNDPKPNDVIYVQIINNLWEKNSSGEYIHDSGKRFPENIEDDIFMPIIINFKISLAVDNGDDNGGNIGPVPGPEQYWEDYRCIEYNGTITITAYTGRGGDVAIPAQINGKPVTIIGEEAFFRCENLTSITIPNNLTRIEERAFYGCYSLTAINVESDNTAYSSENGVWYNRNKTTLLQYPAGKTAASFTIPNSVTSIGYGAFHWCDNLTSITIPNRVTSIGDYAFVDCRGLTSVTIGNGVISIGQSAFGDCTSLTSVTIGNGVISIGQSAFFGCTSLTSVTIPNSVDTIGSIAFFGCTSLTSVTFVTGSNITDDNFGSGAFPGGHGEESGNTSLKTAYSTGKAGTYTRDANGETWTKQ